jgi:hypothetical protein
MKEIRAITPDGVAFVDETGEEGFIDFAACHQSYVARRTNPAAWQRFKQLNRLHDRDFKRYVRKVQQWKEVGQRDNGSGPGSDGQPFITFYTDPPSKFVFSSQEEYEKVRNAIWEAGWQTFDLT